MSWAEIIKMISECDVVIEVIDARFPLETRSRKLEEIIKEKGKRLVIVINKCDLVSRKDCEKAKFEIQKEGIPVVLFSAKKRWGSRVLRNTLRFIANELGLDVIKAGIVGYANVGKSSVASLLKGRSSAKASPKPGFTRGIQWIRVSRRIRLLDSPGIIPMKEGDVRLALKGSLDITKLEDPELVAYKILESLPRSFLESHYPGIPEDPEKALEFLAKRWNMLRKGGEPDLVRAARKLVLDWQKGKLWG